MTTQPFEFNEIEKKILNILENDANLIQSFNNLNKENQLLVNNKKAEMIKLINSLTNYNIVFLSTCNSVQVAICGSCHLDLDRNLSLNILNKTYNKFLTKYDEINTSSSSNTDAQKEFNEQIKSDFINILKILSANYNQMLSNPSYVINVGIIKECSDILNDKHKALNPLFH